MRVLPSILVLFTLLAAGLTAKPEAQPSLLQKGQAVYAEHCASCHGDKGQGVDDEYDEPLWGSKTLERLTRYIHKSMPEDKEEEVVDEEAAAVAKYIYETFYSPESRHRERPPRVDLLRLTNGQYRQSIADLSDYRGPTTSIDEKRGLKARYHNSEKMAKEKQFLVERIDRNIDFDYAGCAPVEGMTQQAFSITWRGSLLAPDSGFYDFMIRTHNGAVLHLNSFDDKRGGYHPFIDAYVSTKNMLREKKGRMYLIGGRPYPIELQFFSYQENYSSIQLRWKPPHGTWEPIPPEVFSPIPAAPVTVVQAAFSADDHSLGFERGSNISREWQESTTFAAVEVANHLISHLKAITRLKESQLNDAAALKEFCLEFAERAFRRPLTDAQRQLYVESRFANQENLEKATRHSLLLILTSPHFLYPGLADNEGAPDAHTKAARLALTLWDSLPDRELNKAVENDKLKSPEDLRHHAWRLLGNPRAKFKIREFYHHWLAMNKREDLTKDAELFPNFDQHVIADLRRSLDQFLADVTWSEESDYRALLLSEEIFLNPRLATFYQTSTSEPYRSKFEKVTMSSGKRAGIFTHPFLLASNAYHDNTSPIHRGVFLSQHVLGRLLKPPPEAVAFKNEDFDPHLTMREKVTELTKAQSCMQCHSVINPIGFSLENFDAVGRYRETEKSKPINAAGELLNDEQKPTRIANARDLAELAAQSERAQRAFIRHLFQHLTKQLPEAYGPQTINNLHKSWRDSTYNMRVLMVEIATLAALHHTEAEAVARP